MKLGLPLGLAFALGACSHAPNAQVRHGEGLVADDSGASIALSYAEADAETARQVRRAFPKALAIAERWGALSAPIAITIHPTHEALEAAAHRPGRPWLRAWARADTIDVQSPRTWSRGEATDEQMEQLLAHELTHCVMFQALGRDARAARGIPAWFREGMATTNAGERFLRVDARRDAGDPLDATGLVDSSADSSLVYATADRAFRYLTERYGDDRIHLLLARVRGGAAFPEAFRWTMGVSLGVFEDDFRTYVSRERTRG